MGQCLQPAAATATAHTGSPICLLAPAAWMPADDAVQVGAGFWREQACILNLAAVVGEPLQFKEGKENESVR